MMQCPTRLCADRTLCRLGAGCLRKRHNQAETGSGAHLAMACFVVIASAQTPAPRTSPDLRCCSERHVGQQGTVDSPEYVCHTQGPTTAKRVMQPLHRAAGFHRVPSCAPVEVSPTRPPSSTWYPPHASHPPTYTYEQITPVQITPHRKLLCSIFLKLSYQNGRYRW